MYNPPIKLNGNSPKKPIPKNPIQLLVEELQFVIKNAVETIKELSKTAEEIKQVAEKKTEELKSEAIEIIKSIEPKKGEPGVNGQNAKIDIEEIVQKVISRLPAPPPLDEKKLRANILRSLPNKKGDLKIVTETVEVDPMAIVDKILSLPEDKFILKSTQIDGLEEKIKAFWDRYPRGYLHGGGDTVVAGNNITITTNTSGQKIIATTPAVTGVTSLNGFSGAVNLIAGSNITLTPSGNNITIASLSGVLLQNGSTPLTGNWNAGAFTITASKYITSGGTSNQFIKGDGTLDSSVYLTGNQSITLSGEASGSGTTAIAVTLSNASVIGKVLTGYVSGAGTVAATDSILQAIQKINGNVTALVTGVSSVNSLTGAIALTGTANRITISAANVFDISASYVGQSSITTLGTITTGVWNGTVIIGTYGGTGVNNGAKTLTYLKNISFTSADDTGVYTLPTGTKTLLAIDGVGTGLSGIPYTLTGTANQVVLSAGTGNITFSLPQSIATSSAVSFASLATSAASPLLLTNGKLVTIALTTQTVNPTTLTIPDFASVSDTFTFITLAQTLTNKTLSGVIMADATNIVLNTTTGTKIGTATNQKLAFYNSTPIVQPTGDVITALQNLGLGASLTVLATTITSRTLWGQTYDGSGNVSGSLTAVGNITGGASSMTITAGTGNSRTMTLQTTTSGGTATTALTIGADQSSTFSGLVALGANNLTMTGSLAATGARVTKGWFTDVESTNMFTVGGTSLTTVSQTFQNKNITNSNNTLGGVTMGLGSDAVGDIYAATTSNVLSRIAAVATGNVLISGGVTTLPSWGKVGLTTHVSGTLPIGNGGTNSASALSNQRVMTSVAGAIVESGAITDGESIQRNNTTFISAPLPLGTAEGRMTLSTGVPVTTADVTAATSIFYTPFNGSRIYLYDGTRWKLYSFSEISLSIAGQVPGTYDMFVYDNAGTITLELLAWNLNSTKAITAASNATPIVITSNAHGLSNDQLVYISGVTGNTNANGIFRVAGVTANTFNLTTLAGANVSGNSNYISGGTWWRIDQTTTRATALTTQNGVYVKTGDTTRRYLGTFYIYQTGQVEDSLLRRHLWNINQQARILSFDSSAAGHTYGTGVYRPWNNDLNDRVEGVIGLDYMVNMGQFGGIKPIADGDAGLTALGLDSTTVASNNFGFSGNYNAQRVYGGSTGNVYTGVGFHYWQSLEFGGGTTSFIEVHVRGSFNG